MGDIAQRGNRLTKKINSDKAYKQAAANPAIVRDVYNVIAHKHSLGAKKKPHSSKEGVTASIERTMRDVGKVFRPERVKKFGGGRTNLLEELGRVEAEPSNRNRRAEISRVHGELNRGYATGGVVREIRKGAKRLGEAAKKHVARKEAAKVQAGKDEIRKSDMGYAKGGKAKKDKKWIQKAVDPKHKGYCTPMTKKTCTPARKALARTFKKKAKTGWS